LPQLISLSSPVELLTSPASLVLPAACFCSTVLVAPTSPKTSVPRRVFQQDRVFTPEVSLGPAFRSLAPPIPALV
jgi:hypothetical protein